MAWAWLVSIEGWERRGRSRAVAVYLTGAAVRKLEDFSKDCRHLIGGIPFTPAGLVSSLTRASSDIKSPAADSKRSQSAQTEGGELTQGERT